LLPLCFAVGRSILGYDSTLFWRFAFFVHECSFPTLSKLLMVLACVHFVAVPLSHCFPVPYPPLQICRSEYLPHPRFAGCPQLGIKTPPATNRELFLSLKTPWRIHLRGAVCFPTALLFYAFDMPKRTNKFICPLPSPCDPLSPKSTVFIGLPYSTF